MSNQHSAFIFQRSSADPIDMIHNMSITVVTIVNNNQTSKILNIIRFFHFRINIYSKLSFSPYDFLNKLQSSKYS